MLIPQVHGDKFRLIEIEGAILSPHPWQGVTSSKSVETDLGKFIANHKGEKGLEALYKLQKHTKIIMDEVGRALPLIKLSDLMDSTGYYRDSAYWVFVCNWVNDHLPEARLNDERPENDFENWDLIPLEKYSVFELEHLDEDGDEWTYWGIENNTGEAINPEDAISSTDYNDRYGRIYMEEILNEGKKYYVFDEKDDAEEVAKRLNIVAQGYDELDHPESARYVSYDVPVSLLQKYGVSVFNYTGPEVGYTNCWELADFEPWCESNYRKIIGSICAEWCWTKGVLISTKIGPRLIDPFN